jgi:2-isopropylmalate synthase
MSSTSGLIYDGSRADGPEWTFPVAPRLNDETLRDGLQSPSVLDPPIEKKLRVLHSMEASGVDSADPGLKSSRQ